MFRCYLVLKALNNLEISSSAIPTECPINRQQEDNQQLLKIRLQKEGTEWNGQRLGLGHFSD